MPGTATDGCIIAASNACETPLTFRCIFQGCWASEFHLFWGWGSPFLFLAVILKMHLNLMTAYHLLSSYYIYACIPS